ncbi:DUF3696 domain-containing protein [Lyngbya sp. CCY1209]|uniref:AAA family ATPase n=1 Tax=Lyngbya sp. CCY1209 TaxID=2886103 RepID=UPI002D204A51|nr:DUF3696 domain-containing protein [Lyngbya sp. CCY1209]MEB3884090.1 DUF3696 domain-containing protein [Lyngbya sp. CCY1209]
MIETVTIDGRELKLGSVTLIVGLPGTRKTTLLEAIASQCQTRALHLNRTPLTFDPDRPIIESLVHPDTGAARLGENLALYADDLFPHCHPHPPSSSAVQPILVKLLSAQPGELVAIEKPELMQHPRTVATLTRVMVRAAVAGIQIVIETDSDVILDGFRIAVKAQEIPAALFKIYNLSHGGDRTEIRCDERGAIEDWPDGFFDQKDADWGKLFEI